MRVLVTGGAGYIGSVMVGMLAAEGYDVLVIDDLSRGHRRAVAGHELSVVDLQDAAAVRDLCRSFEPEACIHFAAWSLVGESVAEPLKYLRGNLGSGLNLLDALQNSGCERFIFSSSCAVYGIPEQVPISESCQTDPVNPYGRSKLMFEQILDEVSRAGSMHYVSLRYFNAAGADAKHGLGEDHDPETHLIPRVIAAALGTGPSAVIYGTDYPTPDGTCIRDYIHVSDLCRAHLLALERLVSRGEGGVYNLGNGSGFSVRQVVDSVRRVSGADFEVSEEDRRMGDPPALVAVAGKARTELSWEPGITGIDEIVETAWLWHRDHPRGYE